MRTTTNHVRPARRTQLDAARTLAALASACSLTELEAARVLAGAPHETTPVTVPVSAPRTRRRSTALV